MEMPSDAEERLAVQQVAGLLNVSVDEVLRLRRPPPSYPGLLGISNNRQNHTYDNHTYDIFAGQPSFEASAIDGQSDGTWDFNYDFNADNYSVGTYSQQDFDLLLPAAGGLTSFTHYSSFPPHVETAAFGIPQQEHVELLNPHYASFECNMDWESDQIRFDDISGFDLNNSSGTDEFVHLTPNSDGSDAQSESAAHDGDIVSSDEEDKKPPVPGSQDKQPSCIIRSQKYQRIAPRPRVFEPESRGSRSKMPALRGRKKRAAYSPAKRSDTNLTRSLNACVRCRIQRNRCVPDPVNPRGPCKPCQEKKTRLSRLPCLRYKLSDSTLFRDNLDYMPFYRAHPMVGPHYGDFHIEKQWTAGPGRYLYLGQGRGDFLCIELRQFSPPHDPTALDLKKRSMYAVNWAIPDPDKVVEALNVFIDANVRTYLLNGSEHMDDLSQDVFNAAWKAAFFPRPNPLMKQTLRLWVVCRFIESKWRCWADPEMGKDDFTAQFPKDPFYDHTSLPPYVDYQLASIIIHRVLMPLREKILHMLEEMVTKHKPEDWYMTFLVAFILLHNYELQMQFQRDFACRRRASVRYLDMSLVRATNMGAKTILAHFHYCCKGQQPFGASFNWDPKKMSKMARLDSEQIRFMAGYRDRVVRQAETFSQINHTDKYDEIYWYTSQLFDPDWTPRDTLEHAPPAEWSH